MMKPKPKPAPGAFECGTGERILPVGKQVAPVMVTCWSIDLRRPQDRLHD